VRSDHQADDPLLPSEPRSRAKVQGAWEGRLRISTAGPGKVRWSTSRCPGALNVLRESTEPTLRASDATVQTVQINELEPSSQNGTCERIVSETSRPRAHLRGRRCRTRPLARDPSRRREDEARDWRFPSAPSARGGHGRDRPVEARAIQQRVRHVVPNHRSSGHACRQEDRASGSSSGFRGPRQGADAWVDEDRREQVNVIPGTSRSCDQEIRGSVPLRIRYRRTAPNVRWPSSGQQMLRSIGHSGGARRLVGRTGPGGSRSRPTMAASDRRPRAPIGEIHVAVLDRGAPSASGSGRAASCTGRHVPQKRQKAELAGRHRRGGSESTTTDRRV